MKSLWTTNGCIPQEIATRERIAAVPAAAGWKPVLLSRGAVAPWEDIEEDWI